MGIQGVIKGLQGATGGYKELQVVTGGYKGLQGVTRGYKGLQGVTSGYKGWQRVTKGYRRLQRIIETSFLLERSQILFLGLFCINIKVEEINFFSTIMDYPLCKNTNFALFLNPCLCCLKRLVI